jgi:hypothetical protein
MHKYIWWTLLLWNLAAAGVQPKSRRRRRWPAAAIEARPGPESSAGPQQRCRAAAAAGQRR